MTLQGVAPTSRRCCRGSAGDAPDARADHRGQHPSPGKLVSLFEPHTEIIRKGKASKPTEFGKMVKIQEAEHQIITPYEVYDQRPDDGALLIPAVEGTCGGSARAGS